LRLIDDRVRSSSQIIILSLCIVEPSFSFINNTMESSESSSDRSPLLVERATSAGGTVKVALPPPSVTFPSTPALPVRSTSQTVNSELETSTVSSRSTSLPSMRSASGRSIRKTVSGLFKRSRKKELQVSESDPSANETTFESGDSSAVISDEELRRAQECRERDETALRGLEAAVKRVQAIRNDLTGLTESTEREFRLWVVRSVILLTATGLILFIEPLGGMNVWLMVACVAVFAILARPRSPPIEEIVREFSLAQSDLSQVLQILTVPVAKEAPPSPQNGVVVEYGVDSKPGNNPSRVLSIEGCPHPRGPDVDRSGYRLNIFANMPGLDFERDVFAPLPRDRQAIFLQFETHFWSKFDRTTAHSHNIPDRFTLLRFLQADKYDIPKATSRMLKTIAWRTEHRCDEFIDDPDWQLVERASALRPRVFCGYDKTMRPLLVEKLGEFFGSDEAYKGISFSEWITSYAFEEGLVTYHFREAMLKHGAPYGHRMNFIGDLAGIRLMTAMKIIPYLKMLVKEVEIYWPEFAGDVVLVNSPPIVTRLFGIVRKFLDPSVTEKISIYGSDCAKELIEKFGAETLPQEYGGDNPVRIPGCPKKLTPEFNAMYPYTPRVSDSGGAIATM